MAVILTPFELLVIFTLVIWFAIFIAFPIKLIFTKIRLPIIILGISVYSLLAWLNPPLSAMSSSRGYFNHCGQLTYTGMFYPVREILTDAHKDDLEARNQMCWVKKLIFKVPSNFKYTIYSKKIHESLLGPERKYRVSLPLIAYLFLKVNLKSSDSNPKNAFDSIRFWTDQYTEDISARQYPIWNWPHSSYIKWEYHFIEENWQRLIDDIVLEPN